MEWRTDKQPWFSTAVSIATNLVFDWLLAVWGSFCVSRHDSRQHFFSLIGIPVSLRLGDEKHIFHAEYLLCLHLKVKELSIFDLRHKVAYNFFTACIIYKAKQGQILTLLFLQVIKAKCLLSTSNNRYIVQ